MRERLEPATDRFVVRPADASKALPEAALALGKVEPLSSSEPLYLLHLTSTEKGQAGWARLVRELRGGAAYPVLLDGDGVPHYPTGEVTVRFDAAPTPEALAAFAGRHHLTQPRGNALAPKQFVFTPGDPVKAFLPDLVERLAAQGGVRAAWANTMGRYRRV